MTAVPPTPPARDAAHRLDLAEEGTLTGARVVCLGDDGHLCRQWCAEGCEEYCTADPGEILLSAGDVELIAQAPIAGHRWEPYGGCRVADWINGVEDTYAGDDTVLRWVDWGDDEEETQPGIRPGLIEHEWTGDDYVWSYPLEQPDVPDRQAPVPVGEGQLVLADALTDGTPR